ncbi:hypothetical protein [Streptomyces coeruleorubidus]|uniref:hypothetical protein n=1 Tax=Streptomyces coeruleorubidus TaxID=116188 RepID=UPI00142EB79F|nr:hypothetical protein [Streptomyces coeruleorubidus]
MPSRWKVGYDSPRCPAGKATAPADTAADRGRINFTHPPEGVPSQATTSSPPSLAGPPTDSGTPERRSARQPSTSQ